MAMNELTQKKYDDIRLEYEKLSKKTYKDVPMYSQEYILKKLSEQFYLSVKTISDVIYYRV
ncbi:hypothetical protein ACFSKN_08210 [Mariniflexile gromovii]|uniref:Uncharacterized protein n=1 Tax=Mariniflexile gromovii TaxID=362523 RepID=A0ABS4BVR5_9FLAO|nr:hypothetical protein [Mariniflexile gromovii]MBP0904165.1 hypothetical protein [Mariniflexile gromovii]